MRQLPALTAPPGYQTQAEDTSIDSDLMFFYLLRQRSTLQRLEMGMQMIRDSRQLSLSGLRRSFPALDSKQFAAKVALAWLQEDCPKHFQPQGNEMTWIQDSLALAALLHQIFSDLEIPYYITGGVAAIVYGEPRTTRDLDLVIAVSPTQLDPLVMALEAAGFYVPGVEDVRSGQMQTLGITHMESISRADLMIAETNEFEQVKFARRQVLEVPGRAALYFISVEDLVLNKLQWGSRQSEKQWRDVLGILKVQQGNLDLGYLRIWAERLQVTALLEQALVEAGYDV